ncbi:MAG: hypothetical protein OEQ29_01805 [Alphaproteobacteria bacterium]|nr:hypothetical protein [Alphaproteobacteria bacterium]
MSIARTRTIVCLAMCAAVMLVSAIGPLRAHAAEKPSAQDPLVAVNKAFRTIYAARRAEILKHAGPIIIVKFDAAVLFHRGVRHEVTFTPMLYHEVKSVSHTVLAVVAALTGKTDTPLAPATRQQLTALRGLIGPAQASLGGRGWPAGATATHRAMLGATQDFLDGALKAGRVSGRSLTGFARAMQPYVLESGRIAAEAQLNGLHALMTQWRRKLGPAWARVWVVNLAPRQACRGNLQHTYLRRLMGPSAVGTRLITGENIFDEKGALRLLGTIILDRAASRAFFGNPARLERDFLSDAATRHVAKIFGDRP